MNILELQKYKEGQEFEIPEIDELPMADTSDLQEIYKLTTRGDNAE